MSASIVVRKLSFWAFVAFLVAYVGILSMAMCVFQFGLGELPCPLCILQRMGMMLASLGALYVVVRALRGVLGVAAAAGVQQLIHRRRAAASAVSASASDGATK